MDPQFPLGKVALAQLFLDKGMEDKAAQEYLMYLGQNDQALDYLEKSYEQHDGWLIFIKASPRYDTLCSEPRFINLLKKMKLDQ